MNGFKIGQSVQAIVHRKSEGENMNEDKLKMRGEFRIEHIRDGEVINDFRIKNGIVNVGLNKLLDVMFHDDTKISTWYIGLINNSGYTGVDPTDTMSSHSGWLEAVGYAETTRLEWTEGAASSESMTNAVPITYNINTGATIKGIFVTSDNTKSGTVGTLWSTALFSSTIAVLNGDQLKVTYTINAASA